MGRIFSVTLTFLLLLLGSSLFFCCNTLNFVIRKLRRYVCVIFVSKCSSMVSFFIARQYAKACRARCFRGQIRSSVRHTLTLVLFLIFQGRAVDEVGSFERTFLNINQSINRFIEKW